ADGVVPGVPPQPRGPRPAARGRVRHGLAAAPRPGRARPGTGREVPHSPSRTDHQLLDVPPMTTRKTIPLDLAAVRERLAGGGKQFWRSLEEVAGTEAFQEMLHREFPSQASEWTDPLTRRRFLTLMGASLALAGLSGCAQQAPPEKIVPYVKQPEQ